VCESYSKNSYYQLVVRKCRKYWHKSHKFNILQPFSISYKGILSWSVGLWFCSCNFITDIWGFLLVLVWFLLDLCFLSWIVSFPQFDIRFSVRHFFLLTFNTFSKLPSVAFWWSKYFLVFFVQCQILGYTITVCHCCFLTLSVFHLCLVPVSCFFKNVCGFWISWNRSILWSFLC